MNDFKLISFSRLFKYRYSRCARAFLVMIEYPWWVRDIRTIWPAHILKSWKVIIIPTASYRAMQLYVALVICVFLQVFCMGMFYNFNSLVKMKNWKWKIVKHEIKHIWLYHQQQCYQSLVLPQNKPPFRVRMISIQPLKTKFGKALERFLASMDMYHIVLTPQCQMAFQKPFLLFGLKSKLLLQRHVMISV